MLSYLADENLHRDIINLIRRYRDGPRIVRVHEVGLRSSDDPAILEFAAENGLVIITQDKATFPAHAYQRVAEGKRMPGVVIVRREARLSRIVEDLVIVATCLEPRDVDSRVIYLPLQ